MIDKIDEENSDNEGDGGNASLHLKKNNYDKSKKKWELTTFDGFFMCLLLHEK